MPPSWHGYEPAPPPMNGHEQMILTRLLDHADNSRIQLDRIEQRMIEGDAVVSTLGSRVGHLEKALESSVCTRLRTMSDALFSIVTPREMVVAAVLTAIALKGILSPADIKMIAFKLVGLPGPH